MRGCIPTPRMALMISAIPLAYVRSRAELPCRPASGPALAEAASKNAQGGRAPPAAAQTRLCPQRRTRHAMMHPDAADGLVFATIARERRSPAFGTRAWTTA
jgi:hypothetical protein